MASPGREPVVHLGLPKTGTTSLQQGLFMGHEAIWPVGIFDGRAKSPSFLRTLHHGSDEAFRDANMAASWQELVAGAGARGALPILSHEELAYAYDEAGRSRPFSIVAERLRELLGPFRVLLVLREQRDLAGSLYGYAYGTLAFRQGRLRSFETFLRDELAEERILSLLHMERVYEAYVAVVGADRVHVATFEDYRRDGPAYVAGLCRWLAVDEERGVGLMTGLHANPRRGRIDAWRTRMFQGRGPGAGIYRAMCRCLPPGLKEGARRLLARAALNPPLETVFPEALLEAFRARFGEGNRRLAEATGLDLAGRGYLLA